MKTGKPFMQRGMTFLEVLVVITLIAILTAIATPQMMSSLDYFKLDATARKLAIDIRLAQSHAIKTNSNTRVYFYVLNDIYNIQLSGKNNMVILPESIIISSTTFQQENNVPRVRFNYLGNPSGGGTVVLRNKRGDRLYVITTPVTGRVRISKEPPEHWEVN